MIIEREVEQVIKFDIKFIEVFAKVRYWEDAKVNGTEDTEGRLIPCKIQGAWRPRINIETGKVVNWTKGIKASIHYKVCDAGEYKLQDEYANTKLSYEGYVPKCLCPNENGYGDYIIMDIDENGLIKDWSFDVDFGLEDFEVEE